MNISVIARAALVLVSSGLVGCTAERGTTPSTRTPVFPAATERTTGTANVTYELQVPATLLEAQPLPETLLALAQAPNLTLLRVSNDEESPRLRAEFTFADVTELTVWQARPDVISLFDRLEAATPESSVTLRNLLVLQPGADRSITGRITPTRTGTGREVESVTCNYDCTRIDITYKTRGNEVGLGAPDDTNRTEGQNGGAPSGGSSGAGNVEDVGDLDATTLICLPGRTGTLSSCEASN